jgi:hypothetical protein
MATVASLFIINFTKSRSFEVVVIHNGASKPPDCLHLSFIHQRRLLASLVAEPIDRWRTCCGWARRGLAEMTPMTVDIRHPAWPAGRLSTASRFSP